METKIFILSILTLLCLSSEDMKQITAKRNYVTLDTTIQKIVEDALYNQLKELNADAGTVTVIETETGNIKAFTNKSYYNDDWIETENFSVNDSIVTESLFKIPNIIVSLEDSIINLTDEINTGNGVFEYNGITIKDRNYKRGGYGEITVEQILTVSSSVGMAKIILKGYENNPNKFIDGLHELGFSGVPKDKPIEYLFTEQGLKMPILEILEFYNSIANGTVKCSSTSLDTIRKVLIDFVQIGMGQPVKSDNVLIAGMAGNTKDSALFCGYFPADNPKYSCIVVIDKPDSEYTSGGLMAGSVFKKIAEKLN